MHLSSSPRLTGLILVIALALLVPATGWADSYLLTAPNWGAKQTAAVEATGATILWSHSPTGLAAVTSDDPAFLDKAQATKAFSEVLPDVDLQWVPDPVDTLAVTPGDETFFALQWNTLAVDAPSAWAAGCTGAGVRVAILDGGIDSDHPDLDDNLDTSCSVSFEPGVPFNQDTGTFWHGTHVAGIVGAEDNGLGVIGIAPEATLVGVKVLHDGSGPFSQVIGGILYAADPAAFGLPQCQRADIINMSLGAVFPRDCTFSDGMGGTIHFTANQCQALLTAQAHAINFAANQGVLVLSAAGNNGADFGQLQDLVFVPAEAGNGLAVSATGPNGYGKGATNFRDPASYSNYGEGMVSVAGPGGEFEDLDFDLCQVGPVINFCLFFDWVVSTDFDNGYAFAFGTSMATPGAAGVAAILKQANPNLPLGALKTKLQQTADDEGPIGHDEFYGHGFVNAYRACTE